MKVYQVLIHRTEYHNGYEDDETTTTLGPTYHARVLADRARDYLNANLPDNFYFYAYATVCEVEVFDSFNENQIKL